MSDKETTREVNNEERRNKEESKSDIYLDNYEKRQQMILDSIISIK